MVVQPSPHGDFHYLVVTRRRTGKERVHEFASEDQLEPGDVLRLDGRYWLIASTVWRATGLSRFSRRGSQRTHC
jgi:hypothetical protein